jgi:hypothetical protein
MLLWHIADRRHGSQGRLRDPDAAPAEHDPVDFAEV